MLDRAADAVQPLRDRAADGRATADIAGSVIRSLRHGDHQAWPFPHLRLEHLWPRKVREALSQLPLRPTVTDGLSGRRELHNEQRHYFDAPTMERYPVCRRVAEAFCSRAVIAALAQTGACLGGTALRIEYALDTEGFWLEPHTDLGIKALTLLTPLPTRWGQAGLGTDLYVEGLTWALRLPFTAGSAVVFTPSDASWHGFEPRPIVGVRRSLIVNFVTAAWRSRDQLAFPDRLVRL